MEKYIRLESHKLLSLPDDISLIQGIVTQDLNHLTETQGLWSLLLNKNGRFLHDFFLFKHQQLILIDTNTPKQLGEKLLYLLPNQKDNLGVSVDFAVYVVWSTQTSPSWIHKLTNTTDSSHGSLSKIAASDTDKKDVENEEIILMLDPRTKNLGLRVYGKVEVVERYLHQHGVVQGHPDQFHLQRHKLGVIECSQDLEYNKSVVANYGFVPRAMSLNKGCFSGHEIILRMHSRNKIAKTVCSVESDYPLPSKGESIYHNDTRMGEMLSSSSDNNSKWFGLTLLDKMSIDKMSVSSTQNLASSSFINHKAQSIILKNITYNA